MDEFPSLSDFETDGVELTYDASETSLTQAIIAANLDPAEWVPSKAHLSSSSKGSTLRVQLTHRLIRPARPPGPHVQSPLSPHQRGPESQIAFRAVVVSDQQCPFHDPWMHEEVCEFLGRNKPEILVVNGDTFDFPEVSSYDPNPRLDTHVNSSLDAGYGVMRDYKQALPLGTRGIFIGGNHEQRLIKYILRHAPNLHGIHRADSTEEVLTLSYLARMDELGYEFLTGKYNDWPETFYEITPGLIVKHGWAVRSGSGQTARAAIESLGVSVILGHTHRAAQVFVTRDHSGQRLVGVEGGTLATIRNGLGYAISPNWQNAFTGVTVYTDGSFACSLISYDPDSHRLLYGSWS